MNDLLGLKGRKISCNYHIKFVKKYKFGKCKRICRNFFAENCTTSTTTTRKSYFRSCSRNGGKAPLTYHQFLGVIACMGTPPQPEPSVATHSVQNAHTPLSEDHDEKYGVPTLQELGFDTEGLNPPVWQVMILVLSVKMLCLN